MHTKVVEREQSLSTMPKRNLSSGHVISIYRTTVYEPFDAPPCERPPHMAPNCAACGFQARHAISCEWCSRRFHEECQSFAEDYDGDEEILMLTMQCEACRALGS